MPDTPDGTPALTEAGDRAARLFRYLRDLSELRTRAVRDIDAYEQVVWFGGFPSGFGGSVFEETEVEEDEPSVATWLTMERVALPKFPEPPASLAPWIPAQTRGRSDLEMPGIEDPEGLDQELPEELSIEFDEYLANHWIPWAKQHRQLLPAYRFYSALFAMSERRRSLGEVYELVVGIGLLAWNSNQRIRRHMITSPCEIDVDSSTGQIEVRPTDTEGRNRLELDMLEPDDRGPGDVVQSLSEEVEEADPLQLQSLAPSIIQRWINRSKPDGTYEPSLSIPQASGSPVVQLAPAIILRKRGQRTLHQLLDDISRQIESGADLPEGVARLVETNVMESGGGPEAPKLGFEDPELYFPLPSNEEQRAIVDRMSSQRGIVVQGPPGTGKSHTIANLTSHLLAQGKRVLITSHTERALHVLRDKLPNEVRSLCVALLGSDRTAISELEGSVEEISFRKADWSDIESNQEVQRLRNELASLRQKRAAAESKLRDIKESGSHPVTLGEYRGTAQQIARETSAQSETLGWIADSVKDESPPLSNDEFNELLRLQFELPEDADRIAELDLPAAEDISPPDALRRLLEEEADVLADRAEAEDRFGDWIRLLDDVDEAVLARTGEALDAHAVILEEISDTDGWVADAKRDVLAGRGETWRALYQEVRKHQEALDDAVERLGDVETAVDVDLKPSTIRHAVSELLAQAKTGGTIRVGLLATGASRRHKEILGGLSVDGQLPTDTGQLNSLLARLDAEVSLEKLEASWAGRVDVSSQRTIPLKSAAYRVDLSALSRVLDLQSTKDDCDKCFSSITSIPEPEWSDIGAVRRIIAGLKAVQSARRLSNVRERIGSAVQSLGDTNTDHLAAMRQAATARDVDAYAKGFSGHQLDLGRAANSKRRKELADRLSIAPSIVGSLGGTSRETWLERSKTFDAAWAWQFANTALQELVDPRERRRLSRVLTETTSLEQRALEQLSAQLAWSRMFRSITNEQSQALGAWAVAVKKIGRGTGKYAERHRRNAREYMGMARDAIPAWIMPTYRVAESLAAGPEQFDVVIVDEASQSGVESLFLFYLAKQVVVVGDDQQIAPEAVGIDMTSVHRLQRQHLTDIPFGDLFDPTTSLYDQAQVRFPGKVILREHFRCMPEIIEFSNRVSYPHRTLTPMRQYGSDRLDPIKTVFLPHGYREGGRNAINRPEAEEIVARIEKLYADPVYDDKSFGVISLQGDSQARLIEQMLLDRIGPEKMLERSLVCGDAYAFQGDERSVIFMSMVAAPNETAGALANEAAKRRFNVAASRAMDQVWLIHSVQPEDLSVSDMRRALLEYYKHPAVELSDMPGDFDGSVLNPPFDSIFEQDVFTRIKSRGFRAIPQVSFAGYRIDLVVEGLQNKLAIECDGDEWHGAEQWEADSSRQRRLERAGWHFVRITGSDFYRNPDGALSDLWAECDRLGIEPNPADKTAPSTVAEPLTTEEAVIEAVPESLDELLHELEGAAESEKLPGAVVLESAPDLSSSSLSDPKDADASDESSFVDQEPPEPSDADRRLMRSPAATSRSDAQSRTTSVDHPRLGRGVVIKEFVPGQPSEPWVRVRFEDGTEFDYTRFEFIRAKFAIVSGALHGLQPPENVSDEAKETAHPGKHERPQPHISTAGVLEYRAWEPTHLPDPRTSSHREVSKGLHAIIEVEGPLTTDRLFTVLIRAAGFVRVTRQARQILNQALFKLESDIAIDEFENPETNWPQRVLRIRGTPPVVVRTLGPRDLYTVPLNEVAEKMRRLENSKSRVSTEELMRHVLDEYGLVRLTTNTEAYLREALHLLE